MGWAVTAIITMTAGAQSSQPSLRSARAPSDSWRLPVAGASPAAPTAAVCVLVLIGPFLSWRPGCCLLRGASRNQALRLQAVVELADHLLLGAHRVDCGRWRHQVRDVDGQDLVERRLRPDAGGLEGLEDVGMEWVVGEQLRIAVQADERRRRSADNRVPYLAGLVTQAQRCLEGQVLVL